jgi:poly-gamma-glutamate synthesis protein (capsule biosynthesis protein)
MGNWTFGGNTNPRDKDTLILRMTVCRGPDGEVSVSGYEIIPCASSGTTNYNNYQPVPYEKDSEGYQRVLDKLNGDFTGSNLSIGYGYSANE